MSCRIAMHSNLQTKFTRIVTNSPCTWPAVNVSVTTTQASLFDPALAPVTAHGWLTLTRGWPLPTLLWHLTLTLTRPQVSRALPEANHTQFNIVYFSKPYLRLNRKVKKYINVQTVQKSMLFYYKANLVWVIKLQSICRDSAAKISVCNRVVSK